MVRIYPLLIFALLSGAVLIGAPHARGETRDWTGGTGDWYSNANWSPAGTPAASDTLNIASGTANLTTGPDLTISGGGAINLSGTGTINRSTTEWTLFGNGSDGSYSQTGGTFLSSSGRFYMGNGGGVFTADITGGTFTYSSTGDFIVGNGGGNATLTVDGGTFSATASNFRVGADNSVSGQGTFNLLSGDVDLKYLSVAQGNSNSLGHAYIGDGTLDIANDFRVGLGGTGTYVQDDGTVIVAGGGDHIIGGINGSGTATINDGTLRLNAGNTRVGVDTTGTLNINGGAVQLNYLSMAQGGTSSVGYVNMSGGTLDVNQRIRVGTSTGTTAVFTQTGGDVGSITPRPLYVAEGASSSGTYHLQGGTLITPSISSAGNSTFNFNGGTLTAGVSTTTWVQGLTNAYVQAGGAVIDTNGFDTTIAQVLQHDPALGGTPDGGLTKNGSGTLTLTGNNTFTGNVAVNGGTLKIGYMRALGPINTAATKVTVASGATVDFNGVADAGYGYTIAGTGADGAGALINTGGNIGNGTLQSSNITLAANAMIGGTGNFALLAPGHAATTLDLGGFTLTKAGTNTFTVSNATFTSGTIHVAGGTFTQYTRAHNASEVAFTFANTAGASLSLGSYDLSVGSLAGGGSTGGGVNLGANTLTVGGLGTSTSYGGTISGTGGLIKTGDGTLTLTGANTMTGGIVVDGGVLAIGNRNAFGPANTAVTKVVVNSGGTVDLNGVLDATYGYTIAGTGAADTGAIINTGGPIGTGIMQTTNIKLAASAMIGGTGNFALLAAGYGPTTLDLNGFTLTKAGGNTFTVSNTTFTPGTIHVAGGVFSQVTRAHDAGTVAFTLANTAGAGLALGVYDLSVGSLSGGGSTGGGVNLGANRLTVGALDTSTTYAGIISGTGGLTKVGDGTLTLTGNSTFTGSVMVDEGILKIGYKTSLGPINASFDKVIVASGATVELNGIIDAGYGYTIAGTGTAGTGAIINTGGGIGNGTLQTSNLRLAADAMIGGTGNFALLAPGHGPTTLDLAGYTLTKAGTNTFTVSNATFTAGNVQLAGGTFTQYRRAHDAGMVAFTLDDTAGATLALGGYDLSIGSLAGGGTTGGNVNLGSQTLTVGDLDTSTTYAGAILGNGNLIKTGSGTLALTGANTYSGTTAVSAGTLQVDGTHTGGGLYTVSGGGTLAGIGTIDATVSIGTGGMHGPGNSVGAQTVSGEIWNPAGTFQLEINDATGTAGGPNGWDLLTIDDGNGTGILDLSSLSASSPFSIELVSLDASAQPGDIVNFIATQPYDWEFVTFDVLEGDFSSDLFTVDSSEFSNELGAGYFKVTQTTGGLALSFIPEPSTLAIALIGLLFVLCGRRRTR